MTNEVRKVEIMTKYGEFVEKIEKAEKGYNIILKPKTKVAKLNGGLVLNNAKGLAEVYDNLKRLVKQAGGATVKEIKPKEVKEKQVKPKVAKETKLEDIQLVVEQEEKHEPQPLDPIQIKRPRRVI